MIKHIVIIGLGKMGLALCKVLCRDLEVHGLETSKQAVKKIPPFIKNKIILYDDMDSLSNHNFPVILAVKPDQIQEVISQIKDDRLIISIAAGINIARIESWRKKQGGVIRVMPNMPFRINMGMSCLMANSRVSPEILEEITQLFSRGGEVIVLDKEDDFHAVTALSGSGPAFLFYFIQAMEDSGVHLGLKREVARKLAIQTVLGSSTMAKRLNDSPQELIHEITSPGGTTIAGLITMKDFGFDRSVYRAFLKAASRSKQIMENV